MATNDESWKKAGADAATTARIYGLPEGEVERMRVQAAHAELKRLEQEHLGKRHDNWCASLQGAQQARRGSSPIDPLMLRVIEENRGIGSRAACQKVAAEIETEVATAKDASRFRKYAPVKQLLAWGPKKPTSREIDDVREQLRKLAGKAYGRLTK